jgi:hypothetical protein
MHCVFRQMPSDRSIGDNHHTGDLLLHVDLFASGLANDKDPMRVKYKGGEGRTLRSTQSSPEELESSVPFPVIALHEIRSLGLD